MGSKILSAMLLLAVFAMLISSLISAERDRDKAMARGFDAGVVIVEECLDYVLRHNHEQIIHSSVIGEQVGQCIEWQIKLKSNVKKEEVFL